MTNLWRVVFLLLLQHLMFSPAIGSDLDDQMKDMADDIGTSLTSISSAYNHRVDWMFVVDHGGFTKEGLHLEYSKYFIQQLATHLYISPMNSQAGVITYGATANLQIPLNVKEGNQCEFNKNVNKLVMTPGKSDMNQALQTAITELTTNGRSSSHKVTILLTAAGWENVGTNPYANVARAKNMGTLIVVVLVFDRAQSIVAPVILGFASDRKVPSQIAGRPLTQQRKYAFEIEAKRGHLRRLYRHFLLSVEQMPYRSLQVPSRHCPACLAREACACDVHLYNTYHCEKDTYEPLITVDCPADIAGNTEPGRPSVTITWKSAQAVDYSSSMSGSVLLDPNGLPNVPSNVQTVNSTHKSNSFPIGVTKVTQQFVDGSGNAINCSFKVTVTDTEVPQIFNCPNSTIYDNTTRLMATKQVYWPTVSSTDNSLITPTSKLFVDGNLKANGDREFPIGTSSVRIDFSDPSGNFASCLFSVVVNDYSPPTVQQCRGPNSTLVYSSDTITYVDWMEPEFIDNSGSAVTIQGDEKPGFFRIGTHTVTYTATDIYGNSASCSFTFTVKGYPCQPLQAPFNGALVCDNIAPGASCQLFCQNPYDFESLPGVIQLSENYSCRGKGIWFPTEKIPHCVVRQGVFKKLPLSYYYDGDCSNPVVGELIRENAASHYRGFVGGQYFKEAYFREANATDFRMPTCGAAAMITTSTSTVSPPTTIPTRAQATTNTPRRFFQPISSTFSRPTPFTTNGPTTKRLITEGPTTKPAPTANVNVIVG